MLDPADGAWLLRHLAPRGGGTQSARSLSMRLGGLPLALYIAGSYLAAPFTAEHSFDAYERFLSDQFEMLMGRGSDDRARVTTTFELSLRALEAHGREQARPLLRILACFADMAPIPVTILDQPILDEILGAPGAAAEGLSGLQDTGLIETVGSGAQAAAAVTVHLLVAETIRHRAGGNLPEAVAVAARLVIHGATRLRRTQFMRWLALVPHLRAVLASSAPLPDDVDQALVPAAARASRALSWAGTSATALAAAAVAESALDRARRTLDDDHPAVFALRSSRAAAWHFLGRYQEAESEFGQIVDQARRSLGPDHPATLYAWGQVAHMMLRDGKAAEAEAELRQVLPRIMRALGSDDSDTLTARHNLAAALSRQGKTAEAEAEYRLVLAKRLENIGPDDPFTLGTRNELARTLLRQDRFTEAEAEFRQVLEDRIRVLGKNHPTVLTSRHGIAVALAGQRKLDAEDEFRSLIADQTRIMGPEHPYTLTIRYDMAMMLADQGRTAEAKAKLTELLADQARILRPGHPDTETTCSSLGQIEHMEP